MSKPRDTDKAKTARPWIAVTIAAEAEKEDRQLWPGEPTADEAARRQRNIVRALRRSDNSKSDALADILDNCDPDFDRCQSAACLECSRLWQRAFVRMSKPFIAQHLEKDGAELVALSVIPSGCTVTQNQLGHYSISNVHRRMKGMLRKAGIHRALGGVDFSLNIDEKGEHEPYWCIHAYIIVATADQEQLRKAIRSMLGTSATVPRPLKISSFKNSARRRSYICKTHFRRRIGYDELKLRKNGERMKSRNVHNNRLLPVEQNELLLYLHQIGLAARPIFYGAKPALKASGVSIVPTRIVSSQTEKRSRQGSSEPQDRNSDRF
jgi:hypothetical protein